MRKKDIAYYGPEDPESNSDMSRLTEILDKISSLSNDSFYLAQCLRSYKNMVEAGNCNACKNKDCEYRPDWGEQVRFNCPFFERKENRNE